MRLCCLIRYNTSSCDWPQCDRSNELCACKLCVIVEDLSQSQKRQLSLHHDEQWTMFNTSNHTCRLCLMLPRSYSRLCILAEMQPLSEPSLSRCALPSCTCCCSSLHCCLALTNCNTMHTASYRWFNCLLLLPVPC